MKVKQYKNAIDMPEKYIDSLVDSEIECWWSKPFDEFLRCTDPSCWKIYSIEDSYWTISNYRNREKDIDFNCECWSKTDFVYKKEEFIDLVKDYIKWNVSSVLLLDDNEKVEWFWVLSKGKLIDIIINLLITRPNSWNISEIWEHLSKVFWNDDILNSDFICSHQIYITPDFRKWDIWIDVLKKMFLDKEDYFNLPIIWETRFDSKFYPTTQILWYKDFLEDVHWYVLQYSENYNDVSDIVKGFTSYSEKSVFREMLKYRKKWLSIFNSNPNLSNRKVYK